MAVTNVMVVVTFPVLVLAMSLLLADRLGAGIFNTSNGPAIYQNLFWFYGHPVVYVMFFPFVGAVAEVVAVFSRRRFFGYRMMVAGLLLFTALSMSVWAHHMFTTGQVANRFFALTSTALIVPAGIEYFDLIATMWGGSIRLATAMLFALGFLAQFVIGGVTGIIVASPPLDYHFEDSYFLVAHFHYTLFAGSLFGLFAGVYYWFPKWTGRLLGEGLGKVHFWMLVLGTNLTFFPMFFLGMDGMPRRVADYPSNAGWTGLNRVATVGAFIIATATLVFLINVVRTLRRPADSPADPWAGHTLEWWTSSPPPRLNFESLPPIHSHAPLLDLRERPAHVP
jgi:cytochrome c oxidase subunit 1